MPKGSGTTAAWKIAFWTTLVFSIGTVLAFSIVYLQVAQGIWSHNDAWLRGEAEVLAHVAADTPKDHIYSRIRGKWFNLRRVKCRTSVTQGTETELGFFSGRRPAERNEKPLWVGPTSDEAFVKAIHNAKLVPGVPQSLKIEGWATTFRLVDTQQDGRKIYLGLSNRGAMHVLRTFDSPLSPAVGRYRFDGFHHFIHECPSHTVPS